MKAEGVVKFNYRLEDAAAGPSLAASELIEARQRLYDMGLIGVDTQGVGFGNTSVKLPGGGFLITATQTGGMSALGSEQLVEILESDSEPVVCRGLSPPSSEAQTHAALYQHVAGSGAVLHIHCPTLWRSWLHRAPTASAEVEYGGAALAAFVAEHVAGIMQYGFMLSEGHEDGLYFAGPSLQLTLQTLLRYHQEI